MTMPALLRPRRLAGATLLALMPLPAVAQQSAPLATVRGPAPGVRVDPVVLVVDPSGAGTHTELAAALQQAPAGALVLVRSGVYSGAVTIDGRGVTVQADAGAVVALEARLTILNVPAEQGVHVAGLELRAGFTVQDCVGPVRLDGCAVPPAVSLAPPPPGTMYWQWPQCGIGLSRQVVRGSDAVTLVDCVLHGRHGMASGPDGTPGEHGLRVESSSVALYGCTLVGGDGYSATSSGHYPVASGAGGDGLRVVGPGSVVRHCGLAAVGGAGGTFMPNANGSFGVTFGCDGVDIRGDAGSAVDGCPVDDLGFTIPPVARTGQLPSYTIEAPASSLAFIMISTAQDWRLFGPESGILHLRPYTQIVLLGPMPSSGRLTRPLPARGPVTALGHVRYELQAYARVNGQDRYSEPRTVVVVDPGL